jgi:Transposase DDE domain group 1
MLRRVVGLLREKYGPRVPILVRLDSGFAHPLLLDVLDELRVKYVVGLPSNKKLNKWAQSRGRLPTARARARRSNQAERVYDERLYQAGKWKHARRVILKAEAIPYPGRELKDNPRFVVTNLRHRPDRVYEVHYCARGDVENRIKELKHGLSVDRTSCSSLVANQFRVILTAAAYLLFQDMRWRLRKTRHARAQVDRLRTCLLKASARATESVRRIVLHLPMAFPFQQLWWELARSLGARRPARAT